MLYKILHDTLTVSPLMVPSWSQLPLNRGEGIPDSLPISSAALWTVVLLPSNHKGLAWPATQYSVSRHWAFLCQECHSNTKYASLFYSLLNPLVWWQNNWLVDFGHSLEEEEKENKTVLYIKAYFPWKLSPPHVAACLCCPSSVVQLKLVCVHVPSQALLHVLCQLSHLLFLDFYPCLSSWCKSTVPCDVAGIVVPLPVLCVTSTGSKNSRPCFVSASFDTAICQTLPAMSWSCWA